MPNYISLMTDYGTRDSFVGSVKGIILKTNPQAVIVDITHEIGPQDLWEAAFTLGEAYKDFPKGTIHLAVVDPGVGSGRRPIVVVTESYFFVGPDNGIFSLIYQNAERIRVHHITSTHYFLPNPGPTFHGRDIFAHVAAALAKGVPSGNFGEEITDFVKLSVPAVKRTDTGLEGHVVHIDRFGNLITNILYKDVHDLTPDGGKLGTMKIAVGATEIKGLKKFYGEAAPGEPGAILNSNGHLEIFLYRQNARTSLSLKRGDVIRVTL